MVFIGLGNPGVEYHETRHNAGFMVIDNLARSFSLQMKKPLFKKYSIAEGAYQNKRIILIKPLTFMNRSGLVLADIARKYMDSDTYMVVVCDNMDLPYGECRVKTRGSNSGHNGMISIQDNYGDDDFIRIYIGISRPSGDMENIPHVLGIPEGNDSIEFKKGVERGAFAAAALLNTSVQRVMNEYNRRNNQD